MFAFQAGWVDFTLWSCVGKWHFPSFFITDRTLSAHRCQVDTPGFLPFCVQLCGVVYVQGLVYGSESLELGI